MGRIELITFDVNEADLIHYCQMEIDHSPFESEQIKHKQFFIIELDEIGESIAANAYLKKEMAHFNAEGVCSFKNVVAALVIISKDQCYTKSYAKKFIFLANKMGCEFIGHPLVERVEGYLNFKTWSKTIDKPLEEIEKIQISKLINRLSNYDFLRKEKLKVLVLHAGHKGISNTLMYWDMIRNQLDMNKLEIEELHVEEGKITDCYGCSFETCTYYSMDKSCFYGGFVVESLFPMIEKADILVWICPNYNDAISAKLMAVINRLTALYRKITFNDKYVLSVVVSGNSGNDSVAGQLIGALIINKGFRLPPAFAAMAIANDPGEIADVKDIAKNVSDYVNIVHELTNKNMKNS